MCLDAPPSCAMCLDVPPIVCPQVLDVRLCPDALCLRPLMPIVMTAPCHPPRNRLLPSLACSCWHAHAGMLMLACSGWHAQAGMLMLACSGWHAQAGMLMLACSGGGWSSSSAPSLLSPGACIFWALGGVQEWHCRDAPPCAVASSRPGSASAFRWPLYNASKAVPQAHPAHAWCRVSGLALSGVH